MDTPASPAAGARLPGLDLIRAVAIAWVMLSHAALFDLAPADNWVVSRGWMGVDLFFVLSGFLIGGQLFRPWPRGERPDYPRFFARRLLRTLPAYLVVLAAYVLGPGVAEWPHIQPLWQFLTFTENLFFDISTAKAFSHVWSLCVEEQFYLVFPAVVALVALKPGPRKVAGIMLAVLVFGMAVRGWLWLHDVARVPFDIAAPPRARPFMTHIYYPTWSRLDGLLAGVAIAAIRAFRPALWARLTARPNRLLALGLAGLGLATMILADQIAGFWPTVFGYPILSFSIAAVVAGGSDPRSLIGRYPVPGAGVLAAGAYSLYLSHKAVFHAVSLAAAHLPAPLQAARLAMALAAAGVVGAALYWGVERPFLKLRERLDRRPRPAPAAPLPAALAD